MTISVRPRRPSRTPLLLVAVATALFAGACGSGSGDGASAQGAPGAPEVPDAADVRVTPDPLEESAFPRYGRPQESRDAEPRSTTGSPGGPDFSAGPCPADGVLVRGTEPEAAMGLRAMSLELVNCGKKPFTVNGYPGIRVLDDDRRQIEGVTVHHGVSVTTGVPDPGPSAVTLRPGETALASLVWRNTVTDGTVPAVNGAFLDVTPEDGAAPQTVRELIDLGTTGVLDVTAWAVNEDR